MLWLVKGRATTDYAVTCNQTPFWKRSSEEKGAVS